MAVFLSCVFSMKFWWYIWNGICWAFHDRGRGFGGKGNEWDNDDAIGYPMYHLSHTFGKASGSIDSCFFFGLFFFLESIRRLEMNLVSTTSIKAIINTTDIRYLQEKCFKITYLVSIHFLTINSNRPPGHQLCPTTPKNHLTRPIIRTQIKIHLRSLRIHTHTTICLLSPTLLLPLLLLRTQRIPINRTKIIHHDRHLPRPRQITTQLPACSACRASTATRTGAE